MSVIKTNNENEIIDELASLIKKIATNDNIKNNEVFNVAVSGGSLVRILVNCLHKHQIDLKKWRIFFCDERIVPENDPDSIYGAYKSNFHEKVNFSEQQFIPINFGVDAEKAAELYIKKLQQHFPKDQIPSFDLLLLGMGPDGHTCSLFPNHKILEESTRWVAPITDSPKPPPSRITLTFPILNNSKNAIFVSTGLEKAEMIKKILVNREDFPAGRVKPKGDLYWILDKGAASLLK